MKTERHLLAMAAKAAGVDIDFGRTQNEYYGIRGTARWWNPGLSTSQAFDLADHLRLMIDMSDKRVSVTFGPIANRVTLEYEHHDRMAVNRLAILLLAAEIGEMMP